ncbi:MAG TPA: hypothetical protein VM221_02815 [Armatimonadota bacterium]|nr:hypothetical protein [Armatimonadota bacterium]
MTRATPASIVLLQPLDCGGYVAPIGAHLWAWETDAAWLVLFHGVEIVAPKAAARRFVVGVDAVEVKASARDEEYNEVKT